MVESRLVINKNELYKNFQAKDPRWEKIPINEKENFREKGHYLCVIADVLQACGKNIDGEEINPQSLFMFARRAQWINRYSTGLFPPLKIAEKFNLSYEECTNITVTSIKTWL